ncbi:hypothetical protein C8Q75DRAFT_91173 [Abortiporus biennis]|nr:hypothetical protein C8Q75DRAFT_91173 [Abortiporus biennis]
MDFKANPQFTFTFPNPAPRQEPSGRRDSSSGSGGGSTSSRHSDDGAASNMWESVPLDAATLDSTLSRICRGYPVIGFLEEIWKTTPSEIDDDETKKYGFSIDLVRSFCGTRTRGMVSFRDVVVEDMLLDLISQVDLDADNSVLDSSDVETVGFFGLVTKKNSCRVLKRPVVLEKLGIATPDQDKENIPLNEQIQTQKPGVPEDTATAAPSESDRLVVRKIHSLFSRTPVAFVSGFIVEETKVTLWYADRMRIIQTVPFDFLAEPEFSLLLAMALCKIPPDYGRYRFMKLEMIVLPFAQDGSGEAFGHRPTFKVVEGVDPFIEPGVLGRGTTVFPVIACGGTRNKCGSKSLVMKVSWQRSGSSSEGGMLSSLYARLSKNSEKNRRVLRSVTALKAQLELKWKDRNFPLPHITDNRSVPTQSCRVLVMKEYVPLCELESLSDFKIVFKDVIFAHYWVWHVAQIRHRDVSVNNIMWRRSGKHGIVGILTDFDLACDVQDTSSDANAIVGTKQTLSIDRLLRWDGRYDATTLAHHQYMHDLEGFFWVLVVVVAGLDTVNAQIDDIIGTTAGF